MTEDGVRYQSTHDAIAEVCSAALQELGPLHPDLFGRITAALVERGVAVDHEITAAARLQSPNLVAVYRSIPSEPDHLEYIQLENIQLESSKEGESESPKVIHAPACSTYAYDGEPLCTVLPLDDALRLYQAPPLQVEDLDGLRFLERDGVRWYDEEDVWQVVARKEEAVKTAREAARHLVLDLPDEFLDLCEEVKVSPETVIRGFVADLCGLRTKEYSTNGSDERDHAEAYFERCGYRFMARED